MKLLSLKICIITFLSEGWYLDCMAYEFYLEKNMSLNDRSFLDLDKWNRNHERLEDYIVNCELVTYW